MLRLLRAELLKLKGSLIPLWTALVVALAPSFSLMQIRIAGTAGRTTWLDFMRSGAQNLSAAYGILLFGFVAASVFGREHAEGTAKELFVLPVRRESIVLAKAIVVLWWVAGLALLSIVVQAGFGAFLGLRGSLWVHLPGVIADTFAATTLLAGTLPIVALLALAGRGYLAPMVYSAVMACVGIGLTEAGWSAWSPWSMPMAVTGFVLGPPVVVAALPPASWAIMLAVFVAGSVGTLCYVDAADGVA